VVSPVFPPSADDVRPLGYELLVHAGEIAGIVLKVGVHRQNVLPACHVEAAEQGAGLAEVSPEREHSNLRAFSKQGLQVLVGSVRRSVIDEHDFVASVEAADRPLD
jgi:hypothetical protein